MKNDLVLLRKTRYIELLLTSFQTFCAVIGRNIGHYLQIFRGCVQRTFSSGRILSASWRFAVQGSSEIKVGKIKMHLKIHTWMLLISLYESHFFHARKRCGLESTLLPNSALAGVLGSWSSWSCRSRALSLLLSQAWWEEIMLKRLLSGWAGLHLAELKRKETANLKPDIDVIIAKWSPDVSLTCSASISVTQKSDHSSCPAASGRRSAWWRFLPSTGVLSSS